MPFRTANNPVPSTHAMNKKNALNWFEIHVADLARAKSFYETILQVPMREEKSETCRMALFPSDMENGVGGALSQVEGFGPGAGGTLVYLNVEGDLDGILARIPAAGGTVVKPRLAIGPWGFIALFRDCEGNVVGLHSLT